MVGVVRQAQVAVQDVDALLAAQAIGFVGDTGHRVCTGDADCDIGRAELRGGGAEAFHETALLEVTLAAVGDHQGDHTADSGDDGQRDGGDVDRRGLGVAGRGDQSQEPVGDEGYDQTGAERGEDRGSNPIRTARRPIAALLALPIRARSAVVFVCACAPMAPTHPSIVRFWPTQPCSAPQRSRRVLR
ncbi:hypothetical protein [Nocardia sp. CA-119907]|uniref:hypothetical protein n=1 Tax=Nocardia sp. CA-119907 TaxID=3239973 RepID=UPI003D97E6C6